KEVTCVPATGATITPTGSGGNGGPYTFELFDNTNTSVSTVSPFTNVAAGSYTVVATDVRGCQSAPFAITVDPADSVTFTPTTVCYDGSNGTINVTINTGNGNYQYSLDGTTWQTPTAVPTFSITGLSAGNYNVTIRDGAGCSATEAVTINPQLLASADPTNASCSAGQILVNPTGGSGAGYEFSVVPDGNAAGTFDTTNPIIGLAANTYDVYVRDDAGCEYIIQDVVIATVPDVAISLSVNEPTCNGDAGSIDGTITAGTGEGPHTIVIRDSSSTVVETISSFTGTNFSFNNLPVDSYTVTITDALGCSDVENVTLTNPPAITATFTPILPTCGTPFVGNESLFGFEFTGYPSFAPYTIEFSADNGATWQTSPTFTGINQGITVFPVIRILDTDGVTVRCLRTFDPYEIPFDVSGLIVDPVANPGSCVGGFSVTVEAINGIAPFEFAIDDPNGTWFPADAIGPGALDPTRTRTFTGLTPGQNYTFYVRDGNGCIEQNNEDLYADFSPTVPITATLNNNQCNGASNGQITYSIDNTSGDLNNNFTWTLFERDPVTGIGAVVGPAYTNIAQTGFADIVVTGLSSGTYYIVLSNTTGGPPVCQFGSLDSVILEGTAISGIMTKVDDITCSLDGTIRVDNVVGGFPGYTYTVTSATNTTGLTFPITLTGNTFDVAYANVSNTTLPVNVTVQVTDTNGCTGTLGPIALNVSQSPTIDSVVADSCGTNNTITINASGGVGPYQFSTDNGTSFSTPTTSPFVANGLAPGSYDIIIRDTNGCTDSQAAVIIYDDVDFNLQVTTNAICTANGEVTLNVTSGSHLTGGVTADYSYSVNGAPTVALGAGNTSVGISLAPGTYNISVTDNNTSCSAGTKSITVQDPIDPNFTAVASINDICDGATNGQITVTTIDNGITPLDYIITPDPNGVGTINSNGAFTFDNLPAGAYTIRGTSPTNNCFTEVNVTIDDLAPIVLTTPNVTQFGCTTGNTPGNATVTLPAGITGGTGNYTRVVFNYTPASGAAELQDSNSFSFTTSNISGGTVAITVYDDQGCSVTTNATINALDVLSNATVTVDNTITCNTNEDITVGFSSISGTNADITIEGINGHTYGPVTQNATSGDFDDLPTGEYQITITHPITSCELVTYHTVLAAPTFDLVISNIQDETCRSADDGSVELSFSPTTPYTNQYDYVVYDAGTNTPVVPAIDGSGVVNSTTIANIPAGTYYVVATLTATAVTGPPAVAACTSQSANFTIEQPAVELQISASLTAPVSCNGSSDATITATAEHGWGSYEYQLEDLIGTVLVAYSNNNVFTGLAAGDYRVRVIDGNGCPRSTT
ncbi:hypothetical protein, partial [Tenacibaculum sp. 190130A14a]